MDKTSESNETKPDKIAEDKKEDNAKKSQHGKIKKVESEEKTEETKETEEETEEESDKELTEEQKSQEKQKQKKEAQVEAKSEDNKPEKKDLKKKKDDNFQYIVRIANTDIDGNKRIIHGLTSIKGVGMHIGTLIADVAGIDTKLRIGDLSEAQIDKIRKALEDLDNTAPSWMLNHRKEYETGENIHLIGGEIDTRLRDEINIMKKIRSYRGIRHERGLPVRGQRTRSNNRKGLALGVSKKREPETKKE